MLGAARDVVRTVKRLHAKLLSVHEVTFNLFW